MEFFSSKESGHYMLIPTFLLFSFSPSEPSPEPSSSLLPVSLGSESYSSFTSLASRASGLKSDNKKGEVKQRNYKVLIKPSSSEDIEFSSDD